MSDYSKTDIGTGYNSNTSINTELGKIETAVNSKADKSGFTSTGDIDMNSNRILNLPNASTRQEPATYGQILDGLVNTAVGNFREYGTMLAAQTDIANISIGDTVFLQERSSGNGGASFWNVVDASTVTENEYDIVTGDATRSFQLIKNKILDVNAIGAYGDGSTDDVAVLTWALANAGGLPIVFSNATYSISSVLTVTATEDIKITGNGCTIKLISASSIQDAVYFNIGENNLTIDDLTVDANQDAYRALHIRNESGTTVKDTVLTNVRGENAYRAAQTFQGGDGILIRGGFDKVKLRQCGAKNINMASGAGISGSEGVFGITVTRNFAGTLGARVVEIIDPDIDNVSSDVDTYYFDQDGIRLLGLEPTSTVIPEGSSVIRGGTIKNCWGRGIKIQRNDCKVIGTTFIRDAGFDTGYGNTEIDFQYGSGQVSNIYCHYSGFNPTVIVNSTSGARKQAGFTVNGINAHLESTTLDAAVQRFRGSTPQQGTPLLVDDVNIFGNTVHMIRYDTDISTSTDVKEYAAIRNCYADDISTAFLRLRGASTTNKVVIDNCADGSNSSIPLIETFSATADLSARNSTSLTGGDDSGTWTPVLEFGGGTTGITYTAQSGHYTRINNLVTCTMYIVLSSKGTDTGPATISGLPYSVVNNDNAYSAVSIGDIRNITYVGQMSGWAQKNTSKINLEETTEAGANTDINDTDFANNSELILTVIYRAS